MRRDESMNEANMDATAQRLHEGLSLHQSGRLDEAAAIYTSVLEADPSNWEARYLLGTVHLQQGQVERSLAMLEQAAAVKPDNPHVQNNLGLAYKAVGRLQPAVAAFAAALEADANYPQAYRNLGGLLQQVGRPQDAEQCYRRALQLQPAEASTHFALGGLLSAQQRYQEAEQVYRNALACGGPEVEILVNLGLVLVRQKRFPEALETYRRVLTLRPDFAEVYSNVSYVLEKCGQLDEAVEAARTALELQPQSADAYNNLGIALRSQHKLDEAAEAFARAVALRPGFALAEFNLATTRMLAGDYRAGWPGYERRLQIATNLPRVPDAPRWNGSPIPGRTLLVYADQGLGDTIQFARFLPAVRERSQARVVLACPQPLRRLFERSQLAETVVTWEEELPKVDARVPIGSLPGIFDIGLDDLPDRVPYLATEERLSSAVSARLDSLRDDAFRVGLVWQGNPQQDLNELRSCPLAQLARLADVAGTVFVSLQREPIAAHAAPNGSFAPIEIGPLVEDMAETAAVMQRLDLVITVDTAAAHLAGALGRPVWTLLCHTPDWRWHLDRTDSPWYPTMRLFRQKSWGDWEGVLAEVVDALKTHVAEARTRA